MFSAITLTYPDTPPLHAKIEIPDPANPARKIKVWSYGAHLLHERYRRVDKKLRQLVAQCLCDQPAHRPGLAELQAIIAHHLQTQNWEEENTDANLVQWVTQNIHNPPQYTGQPLPGMYWVDI
jgi:hypothetical protein